MLDFTTWYLWKNVCFINVYNCAKFIILLKMHEFFTKIKENYENGGHLGFWRPSWILQHGTYEKNVCFINIHNCAKFHNSTKSAQFFTKNLDYMFVYVCKFNITVANFIQGEVITKNTNYYDCVQMYQECLHPTVIQKVFLLCSK